MLGCYATYLWEIVSSGRNAGATANADAEADANVGATVCRLSNFADSPNGSWFSKEATEASVSFIIDGYYYHDMHDALIFIL